MQENMNKTLFILGNGFDLFMGLQTSYYMSLLFEVDWKSYNENLENEGKNVCNEEVKKHKIDFKRLEPRFRDNLFFQFLISSPDVKDNIKMWKDLENKIKDYVDVVTDYLEFNKTSEKYKEFIKMIDACIKNNIEYKICLLNHLKEFEHNFGNNFISTRDFWAIHKKNEFENKIYNFFNLKNQEVYVISFNYTTYLKCLFSEFNDTNFFNIHGTFKEPIFGIGFYGEYPEKYNLFVKENRYDENKTINKKYLNELPNDINKIIIFGHSLSELDYSDFKNIFNKFKERLFYIDIEFRYFEYNNDKSERLNIEKNSEKLLNEYLKREHKGKRINDLNLFYKEIDEFSNYI